MASTWRSPALQLQFINAISTPVVTSYDIKGKDDKPFALALVDVKSQVVVSTRIIASIQHKESKESASRKYYWDDKRRYICSG
ncbi:hypothetical protein Tco_0040588 [Tanacetum coccineum]